MVLRWLMVGVLCVGLLPAEGVAKDASPEAAARAEAAFEKATADLDSGRLDEAVAGFQAAIEANEEYAPAYVGLGHAYLKQGNLGDAEDAFKQALRKEKKYPPAFNGLGLVYREKKNELRRAIRAFRDAVRADETYSEAQYNLAQTYQRFGSSETLGAYEDVLEMDPEHPDASFQIGMIHEADREYEKAETAYRRQVEVKPDHYGTLLHLGMVLKAQNRADEAVGTIEKVLVDPNPYQRRAVLELAEVHQRRMAFDRSQALFETYISGLDPKAQRVYYDVSLVAGGAELEAFQKAPPEDWAALSGQFWQARDPAPVTGANERQLEHYRRVAFALEHFGTYVYPWDDRGDAYVRYGDPDHVGRSGNLRIERDPRVVAVKENLIAQSGEAGMRLMRNRAEKLGGGGSSRTMGREQGFDADAQVAGSSILGWPVYPVPIEGVWEYWIYATVGPGIELTFVQQTYPGPYRYADAPLGTDRVSQIWQDMNPRIVLDRVASRIPDRYQPDFATGPLEFYFYSAAFKGAEGKTALEIYYGIPTRDLAFVPDEGGERVAYLARGVAVYDASNAPVYRESQTLALRAGGAVDTSAGAFVPEIERLALSPGNYRLSVQVLDHASGKSQVYSQDRDLPDFSGGDLMISDVELAASIGEAGEGTKFSKGNLRVVPMASRAFFQAEPVHIYFEVYNLTRDEFGQTRYKVSYEVRSLEQKSVGAKILGGFGKLLGMREEGGVITIEYEQLGTDPDERAYLELDMASSEPGVQLLRVRVTDENSGQSVGTTARFTIR